MANRVVFQIMRKPANKNGAKTPFQVHDHNQAAVVAGSAGLTAAGVPPLPPPDGGVRGVQSLGGRGSRPAMMSSSC
jgi:hypothetical protein